MPFGIGMPRGHFSHVFIDEAGQASEPEVMIGSSEYIFPQTTRLIIHPTAIKTIVSDRTNVVLSGDPKQLGPIIHSDIAKEFGLDTSFLERLTRNDLYDEKDPGNSQRLDIKIPDYTPHLLIYTESSNL